MGSRGAKCSIVILECPTRRMSEFQITSGGCQRASAFPPSCAAPPALLECSSSSSSSRYGTGGDAAARDAAFTSQWSLRLQCGGSGSGPCGAQSGGGAGPATLTPPFGRSRAAKGQTMRVRAATKTNVWARHGKGSIHHPSFNQPSKF